MFCTFLNGKFAMNEEYFEEGMKDIHYVNEKPPVFQMTYCEIKSGKSCVSTGDNINFVTNKKYL